MTEWPDQILFVFSGKGVARFFQDLRKAVLRTIHRHFAGSSSFRNIGCDSRQSFCVDLSPTLRKWELIWCLRKMEIQEPLTSTNRPRHPTLSPLRILRGASLLVMFLSTAFMLLVCIAPWTAVVLRFFSVHYSRVATSCLFGAWLSMWPLLFEKINGTKVVFSGEYVPEKERVLILANHRTEVDWMYLWDLAARKGRLGYIRYVLKSSLMRLPVFGWAFQILEFIPVERKWELDESKMLRILSSYKDPDDPLWLVVFPEGTDYT